MRRLIICSILLALAATANAAQPIRLGLNYPSTGNYKSEGLELRRGALLAIETINQQGGVLGRPLELISRNSAAREEKARFNIDKFAAQGASMAFGGATSEEAIAAGHRARELEMIAVVGKYFPWPGVSILDSLIYLGGQVDILGAVLEGPAKRLVHARSVATFAAWITRPKAAGEGQ